MLEVYKAAFKMGFSVTFITGRDELARDSTEKNLRNEGFGAQCSGPR